MSDLFIINIKESEMFIFEDILVSIPFIKIFIMFLFDSSFIALSIGLTKRNKFETLITFSNSAPS